MSLSGPRLRRYAALVFRGLIFWVVLGLWVLAGGLPALSLAHVFPRQWSEPSLLRSTIRQQGSEKGVPTNEWAVQLWAGTDPFVLAEELGAKNLGPVGTLENVFLFAFPRPDPTLDELAALRFDRIVAQQLEEQPRVRWFEQQFARQQHLRDPITDPLFPDQWHLENTGQAGGTTGQDVNVRPVWDAGIQGAGVVIGIVDDGLQHTHPDLQPNYLPAVSHDFNDDDPDPSPDVGLNCDTNSDCHGTAVAGVAAARDDGTACGVGAAFRAGLAGLRLIAAPSTDADEASALTHEYQTIDIFSNSWGPDDDARRLEGPGTLTRAALADGVTRGRQGLGTIYMWAAGNGGDVNDNVNYDGYANSRYTIAVGAVDNKGVQSWYSEPGAAMLVTAPSDGDTVGITTTDLRGLRGYNRADCTDDFGGTSSATPLAAGVVALMLEANPQLTWRDVQHVLVRSAVRNDPSDSDWKVNGAGRWVNHKYGFGRIDAQAAVALAQNWTPVAPAIQASSGVIQVDQAIPDNNQNGVSSSFEVKEQLKIEHVEVVLNVTHPWRGDLEVVLTSPAGTESVLAEKHSDSGNDYKNWMLMSVRHWDELSAGIWTLRVADRAAEDRGTFQNWTLIVHGTSVATGETPAVTDTPTSTTTPTSTASPTLTTTPSLTPTQEMTATPTATLTLTPPVCYDLTGDDRVDDEDVAVLVGSWRLPPPFPFLDCDGDNRVTIADVMCLINHWGNC